MTKKLCDTCGKEVVPNPLPSYGQCDGVLTFGTDPFAEEIRDDHTESWDCMGNRYESAMDV